MAYITVGRGFMNTMRTFWLLGGDLRQTYLARLLTKDGHRVFTYATSSAVDAADPSGLSLADCVVFPLPVCARPGLLSAPLAHKEQPIDPLLGLLRPGQLLYGGRADEDTLARFSRRGANRRGRCTACHGASTCHHP